MHLASVNKSIRVLLDGTQTVDLFASWDDRDSHTGAVTDSGDSLSTLATTTAAAVMPAPAVNNRRELTYFSAKAKLANSALVTARVQMYDATAATAYDLFSAPLNPGDNLTFDLNNGFRITPASGYAPTTADLVQQFIDALTNPSPNLPT